MPGGGTLARLGDLTQEFGVLTIANPVVGVTVNGRPPATIFTLVTPHVPCSPTNPDHCESYVMEGTEAVLINKLPVTFTSALTWCLHPVITGATGVIIKG